MSDSGVAQLTRALQRVPGVLLAEVHAATSRAIVAHDSGVPIITLLAAVTHAGAKAKIVAPAVAVAEPARRLRQTGTRQILLVATAAFGMLAIFNLLVRGGADKHWVLPVLVWSIGVFYFAAAIARRRA
jgi:hypothetical protein